MFLRTSSLTSLLALAFLSACAKSGNSKGPLVSAPQNVSDPAQGTFSSTCKQSSECSASVALLNFQDGSDSRQCVGSLIADDVLVTASHCLSYDLSRPGTSCKKSVRIAFPAADGYPALQAECQEIISVSPFADRNLAQQDYAVIRISSTGRPAFKVNHNGFQANASFQVLRAHDGSFSSQKCRALQRTEALPGSDQAESPVMIIADCDIDPSSEGAPLLDASGTLHGILQSVLPPTRIARNVNPRAIPETGISTFSYATNFSCVRFPLDTENFAFSSACQANPNQPNPITENDKNQSLINQSIQITESRFQWPNLSSDLKWGTQAISSSRDEGGFIAKALGSSLTASISIFTIPFPKCVNANALLSATTFNLPVVGYEFALDRYLMLGLDRGRSLGTVRARYQVNSPHFRWNSVASSLNKSISLYVDIGGVGPDAGNEDWKQIADTPLPTCSH